MAIFSRKQCSSENPHYAYVFCHFSKEMFCPLGASLRSAWESVRFASERSRVRIPLGPPICRIVLYDAAFLFVLGSCFFNTAAHRDVIQASCYPITSKTNYTTIVFKSSASLLAPDKEDPNLFSKETGSDFLFLAACPAAQQ